MSEFKPGDRVVLDDGRHGMVEGFDGTSYTVFLDVLETVKNVKAVQPEPHKFSNNIIEDRVPVFDGVIDPKPLRRGNPSVGVALMNVFNCIRWIANNDPNADIQEIVKLPHSKAILLNEAAIQNWNEIHHKLIQLLQTRPKTEQRFLLPAMFDKRCLKSWDKCIVADFWFVARDYTGAYVIPDTNKNVVYKIVGIGKSNDNVIRKRGDPPSLNRTPTCARIMVAPFYGRLLYDSTSLPTTPIKSAPSPFFSKQLQMVVMVSIQKNRVVQHFAELESQK